MARKSARIPAFSFFMLLAPRGNDGYCHAYSQASSAKENGSTIVSHSCQTSRWRVTRFPDAITGSIDCRATTLPGHCEIDREIELGPALMANGRPPRNRDFTLDRLTDG